jgi:hypothetical protein
MADDHGPVVQSGILRAELVRLRRARDLSPYDVAHQLGWSPTKLIRIEGGRNLISPADLSSLLDQYGISSQPERERLQTLNQGARGVGWWNAYRNRVADPYLDYVGYETGAIFIRQYVGAAIPGLLQTQEYAEAMTEPDLSGTSKRDVVSLRIHRQTELERRSSPPRRYFILDEGVIRRHVGINKDRTIMPNQLLYIADKVSGNEDITVRVIPFTADAHIGLTGPFTLLEFEGGLPDLLYLDSGKGERASSTVSDPDVAEYADQFEALVVCALSEPESLELLRVAAEEMS